MSAAEWIAATGTAGATLLTGGALALQQRDRRRAMAERVTGWLDLREQQAVTFQLLNSAEVPVYEVVAFAVFRGERVQAVTVVPVLPPGEHSRTVDERYDPDHLDATYPPTVALKFRDAAGRCWHRDATGRLSRLRKGYNPEREFVNTLNGLAEG